MSEKVFYVGPERSKAERARKLAALLRAERKKGFADLPGFVALAFLILALAMVIIWEVLP